MESKAESGIMLTLLLIGMLTLAFNIQPVRASGTIFITSDYTFTNNIYETIVVLADNIVIDGNGYTLQGTGSEDGINLYERSNVTIKNMKIIGFQYGKGILLSYSSNNSIYGNNITNNWDGIHLHHSSNNTISGNDITNNFLGISLGQSDDNCIYGNNIKANSECGISLTFSSSNTILGNNITNNWWGIGPIFSYNNFVCHNNFVNNSGQVYHELSTNVWDDGYPSGGNYWSDHVKVDDYSGINQNEPGSDGIVDEPYIIGPSNRDNYPLVEPWSPKPPSPQEALEELTQTVESWNLGTGIENSLTSKLQVAHSSLDRENQEASLGQLKAFINQVKALRGKKL